MRIAPSQEQLDYLASLGIPPETSKDVHLEKDERVDKDESKTLELEIGLVHLLTLLFAIILILVFWADAAWGEQVSVSETFLEPVDRQTTERMNMKIKEEESGQSFTEEVVERLTTIREKVDKMREYTPVRQEFGAIPDANEKLQSIIDHVAKEDKCLQKPTRPTQPWTAGLTSHMGNVRSSNDDYGWWFVLGGKQVLVVADGCGGLPYAKPAAYIAVVSATACIISAYNEDDWGPYATVQRVAQDSVMEAAWQLALFGDKYNAKSIQDGWRTTLITVIADGPHVGYAYIGDGGGYLVRCSGEVIQFLKPQKAEGLGVNVLSASLGPRTMGEVMSGRLRRNPGDMTVIGSDGVFDRVDASFPHRLVKGSKYYHGDLQRTVEQAVRELASFKDEAGYICDDNMTLGLMGDGTEPDLVPHFINSSTM